MIIVFSSSLHSNSRSRVLAQFVTQEIEKKKFEVELIDLAKLNLPRCDGESAYSDPNVIELNQKVKASQGIVMATPIYNYSICSEAKNLIELTGQSWRQKVAGFLCAAGGQGSYMAIMNLANSLMLDFRTHILPRFVYATGDKFTGNEVSDVDLIDRLKSFAGELVDVSQALGTLQKN